MKYLINTVLTYRVHTVEDVEKLHEELKQDHRFELVAFSYTTKDIKVKREVVDQYQVVKAKCVFTDEKDPEALYDVDFVEV